MVYIKRTPLYCGTFTFNIGNIDKICNLTSKNINTSFCGYEFGCSIYLKLLKMFKKLKEKITEEVKISPQRFAEFTQSVSDRLQSNTNPDENFFSIGEDGKHLFHILKYL